jgi:hypothetical protein
MSNLANFFSMPLVQTQGLLNTANNAYPTNMNSQIAFSNRLKTGYDTDLGKMSLDSNYFQKIANIVKDLNTLKGKQKSDPNSRSLASIIKKKEEILQQLNQVAEQRNKIVYGSLEGTLKGMLGYFA